MRLSRVPELLDQRMGFEHTLHDGALHALAASVNQTDFAQAGFVSGPDIFLDYRRDVTRGERVQVESAFDGNPVGHSGSLVALFLWKAKG